MSVEKLLQLHLLPLPNSQSQCSVRCSGIQVYGYFVILNSGRFAIKAEEDGFIFIDRNGDYFSVILDFLRYKIRLIYYLCVSDGKVALSSDSNHLENLRTEADYFRIDKLVELIDEKLGKNNLESE
jgi:hypothetical protein